MVEYRHIRAFVSVAEELHFGRAAERLSQSQPTLSRTINALERIVGVPLLRRTTRHVELTPAGEAFLVHSRGLLGQVIEAVDSARRAASGLAGTLVVAYMDFAILGVVPSIVAGFRREHPDITVELRYSWTERQKSEVLNGDVDVGFMIAPFHAEGVDSRCVDSQRYVVALPEWHPLAAGDYVRLRDLADEPYVLGVRAEWGPMREAVFQLCSRAGFSPSVVEEAHSRDGIFGFVAAGLGVTIYTDVAFNSPRQGVAIRPLANIEDRVEIIAAWRERPSSPVRARFLTFLEGWTRHEVREA